MLTLQKMLGFHTSCLDDIWALIEAGRCYGIKRKRGRQVSDPGPTGNLDKFEPGTGRSVSAQMARGRKSPCPLAEPWTWSGLCYAWTSSLILDTPFRETCPPLLPLSPMALLQNLFSKVSSLQPIKRVAKHFIKQKATFEKVEVSKLNYKQLRK